jgi:hypothetical protein
MFSSHFKNSLKLLSLIVVILLGLFVWLSNRIGGDLPTSRRPAFVLNKKDKEEVRYNANTHMLTTVSATGSHSVYTRHPDIHIQKDGKVIFKRQWLNLEASPFLGVGYGNGFNTYAGLNMLNLWRLDFGPALSYGSGRAQLLISGSYNIYGGVNVGLGLDTSKTPHLLLEVKFW